MKSKIGKLVEKQTGCCQREEGCGNEEMLVNGTKFVMQMNEFWRTNV